MQLDKIGKATIWRRSVEGAPAIPKELPPDYRAFIERFGPGEGFIGSEFLRLYPPDQLARLNEEYEFPEYLPGLLMFGSTGLGEAYSFDLDHEWEIFRTAFVPLDREYGKRVAANLSELLDRFAAPGAPQCAPNPRTWQKELEYRHPLALGGTAESANQILVPPDTHVKLVRFWAKAFREVKRKARPS